MKWDRNSFLDILQRYIDGTCTAAEKAQMDYWYGLLDEEEGAAIADTEPAKLEELLWDRIQARAQPDVAKQAPQQKGFSVKRTFYLLTSVAASLLLIGGWLYLSQQTAEFVGSSLQATRKINEIIGINRAEHVLSDGSKVILEPNSRIWYEDFTDVRKVHLEGDAYFDVARDPDRPFLVYTGELLTTVVGTTFTIRSSQKKEVEVAVHSGKVIVGAVAQDGVFSKRTTLRKEVVLTPNQKVIYELSKKDFILDLVDEPRIVVPSVAAAAEQQNLFVFEGVPLDDVLHLLEKTYGIQVVTLDESLRSCPVTADLSAESLYTKLDIICAALNAQVDKNGTRIILKGGGCY